MNDEKLKYVDKYNITPVMKYCADDHYCNMYLMCNSSLMIYYIDMIIFSHYAFHVHNCS